MVWPTISGKIVDVRDQVRTICFWLASFMRSIRVIRRSSANGPFLLERLICLLPLPLALAAAAATDDVAVGRLVLLTGAVAQRRHAPRGHRGATRRRGALAAAVRVVDRGHGRAARLRAHAHVTLAAGLADLDVLVVGVADHADGGAAVRAHQAHLAGGQAQRRHVALLRHELDAHAGRATELAAAARLELDVVHDGARRHVAQRQRVAHGDLRRRARHHGRAHLEAGRSQDVGLDAVGVVQQRDVRGPVRVVLDRGDLGGDPVPGALEVDLAVQALGAAAAMAGRLAAVGVAPAGLLESLDEGALRLRLRDLREVGVRDEAPAGAGGLGLADGHGLAVLEALEDRDGLTRGDLDDRLLPGPRAPGRVAAALGLGLHRHRADLDDLDFEELLDRLADLGLVRVRVDAERVLVGGRQHVGLLADDGPDDHLDRIHQATSSCCSVLSPLPRAASASSASGLASTLAAAITSATPTLVTGSTARTWSRLRKLSAATSWSSRRTTRIVPLAPQSATSAAAAFVDGVSNEATSKAAIVPRSAWTDSALRNAARRSLRLTLNV